ncbi:hypothetical protein U1Q18_036193 [Sarracenia purpurea var. burkii]
MLPLPSQPSMLSMTILVTHRSRHPRLMITDLRTSLPLINEQRDQLLKDLQPHSLEGHLEGPRNQCQSGNPRPGAKPEPKSTPVL